MAYIHFHLYKCASLSRKSNSNILIAYSLQSFGMVFVSNLMLLNLD